MLLPMLVAATALATLADAPPLPPLPIEEFPPAVRARVAAAERLATEDPGSADAAGALGMLLHAYDQLSSAAAAYDRARALDPDVFAWPYLAGVARLRLGRAGEAEAALKEAVAREPGSLPARLRLGEALLVTGDVKPARILYRALVAEHPEAPQGHYGLGRAAAALGDAAAAIESYRAAVRAFPAYAAAHYALALLLRAGLSAARGEVADVTPLLERATAAFDAAQMAVHANVARRRLGETLSGEEGRSLVHAADAWMHSQGIRNPARYAEVLAPNLAPRQKA